MGRFDQNLNVMIKNIPIFPPLFERQSGLSKGREREYGRVGSTKGARGMRKGNAFLSSRLPRGQSTQTGYDSSN